MSVLFWTHHTSLPGLFNKLSSTVALKNGVVKVVESDVIKCIFQSHVSLPGGKKMDSRGIIDDVQS